MYSNQYQQDHNAIKRILGRAIPRNRVDADLDAQSLISKMTGEPDTTPAEKWASLCNVAASAVIELADEARLGGDSASMPSYADVVRAVEHLRGESTRWDTEYAVLRVVDPVEHLRSNMHVV